ncbi:P-loop containing nucleoside triphosphate hydrolase protein [Hyaloraphidium curvatum]|nr:P-loop containing nucleoside triphosphate hydrolase protein [Hyaloraphidium curvatum]
MSAAPMKSATVAADPRDINSDGKVDAKEHLMQAEKLMDAAERETEEAIEQARKDNQPALLAAATKLNDALEDAKEDLDDAIQGAKKMISDAVPDVIEDNVLVVWRAVNYVAGDFIGFLNKRGSIVDTSLGLIIASALQSFFRSTVDDVFKPLFAYFGLFSAEGTRMRVLRPGKSGARTYESLQAARNDDAIVLAWGHWRSALGDFASIALGLFIMAKIIGMVQKREEQGQKAAKPLPPAAPTKTCKRCLETVNAAATGCKYCGRSISSAAPESGPSGRGRGVGLLLALGFGAAVSLLDSERRSVHAKSLSASARELCMLTRLNDVDALNRLFPEKGKQEVGGRDASVKHPFGWAPLHVAAANNNLKLLLWWLDRGAGIDLTDDYAGPSGNSSSGFEAVFEIIRVRQQEFSPYLDPRASFAGFTALHYACLNGNRAMIEALLARGADPTRKDNEGRIPRDYLDSEGLGLDPEMAKLFDEAEKTYTEEKRRREREQRRKFPLEAQLKERIVGQEGPINSVASAIRRRENGWHDTDKPLVFLFLGSSGIGKTELAKQLASYVHKDNVRKGFIRMDMSEFQSKHEVSKFIGSPPGYVGFEEGGQLTEKLKACPDAIVLLDEVEKAHVDVLTVLLALFDEGRLTDGKGTTVACPEAIFVMTSNLAQQEIGREADFLRKDLAGAGPPKEENRERSLSREFIDKTIYPILRRHFGRDEFLGRINEILFFLPFSEPELHQLAEKELRSWRKRSEERHGIRLEWDDAVVRALCGEYNPSYGARSIKHGVERKVINQIARAHEADEIGEGSTVRLYVERGEVRMNFGKPKAGGSGRGIFGSLFGGGGGGEADKKDGGAGATGATTAEAPKKGPPIIEVK